MAATFGWGARYVERELTDELLVLYLDAAFDRLGEQAMARLSEQVDTVRAGTIFAHDGKQYERWRSDVARRTGRRSEGKTLAQLARDLGGQVGGLQIVHGEFEFRN